MKKAERNSTLELLRIFCILGILCMHLCGTFSESGDIVTLIQLNAVNSLFNICVSVFILISGYFGITRRIDKMFSLWCIVIFYSILGAAVPILLGNPPELTFLLKSLFPTVTGKYWYFTTYFILWLFSPYLNRISEALTRKQFKILLLLLVLVFYVFPTFFYFEIVKDNGKGPVNMLIVYLIGRYLNKYPVHPATWKKVCCFFLSVTVAFALNFTTSLLRGRAFAPFARDNSLFMLCGAICCFLCFKEKESHSAFINLISKNIFAVYISEIILRNIIHDYSVISFLDGKWYLFVTVFGLSLVIFTVCSLFESLRKLLFHRLEKKLSVIFQGLWNHIQTLFPF